MSSPALAEPWTAPRGPLGLVGRVAWAAGWPARMVLAGAIRLYRATLSGLLGGQCRFHPTCSVYAEAAIRSKGAVVGSALAAWRILRCNPFGRGGVDAPPERPYDAVIRLARERAS